MSLTTYACDCGSVELSVAGLTPKTATRARCYCVDCQAFARHLKHAGTLDANGGTDLTQIAPDALQIVKGEDRLVPLQLSPKGLFRWHATCCNTPMINGGNTAGLPFTSVLTHALQGDANKTLGSPKAVINTVYAYGPDRPLGDRGFRGLIWQFLKRFVVSRVGGGYKANPLWKFPERTPLNPPIVLSKEERRAASVRPESDPSDV